MLIRLPKTKTISALLMITVALFASGCASGERESPKPTSNPTSAPSATTEEPSGTPSPDTSLIPNVFLQDFSKLDSLTAPDGAPEATYTRAKETVSKFVTAQTSDPLFLTGAWEKASKEEIITAYGVQFTKPIQDYFMNDMGKSENAITTQSLGLFFTPNEKTKTVPSCTTESTQPEDCLYGDYSVTTATVVYDKVKQTYSFNVIIQGSQNLIVDSKNVPLEFQFNDNITVNKNGDMITGLQNAFTLVPPSAE